MSYITSLLNKKDLTPLLKPGQNVRIEPLSQFGFYQMPRSAVPELLPPVDVNLATPFTTSLAAMSETGQTSPISTKITALDVGTLTLGHYRLYTKDPAVRFEIYQPATTARFANKSGPISFDAGTSLTAIQNGDWSLLPEVFVYEDKTPLTVKAYSMDLDAPTFQARFTAVGFKYPLMLYDIDVNERTGEPMAPLALTVKCAERV